MVRRWAAVAAAVTVVSATAVGLPAGPARANLCLYPREINIHGPAPRAEGTQPPGTVLLTNNFVFTVTSRWCPQGGTIQYSTTGLGAVPGNDFVDADGTLTFAAGDATEKQIIVRVWQDAVVEPNEGVFVCLHSPTGWVETNTRSATTTFLNDDGKTPPSVVEPEPVCSR